jgi:hypothetical protein
MNRVSFRLLLGGVVLTTLCSSIACGDDDNAPEPNFEVDHSDASAEAGSPNGNPTSDAGDIEQPGDSTSSAVDVTTSDVTVARDGGSDTTVTEGATEPSPDAGTTGDIVTSNTPDETTSGVTVDTGDTGEPEDCVRNPTTHLEIINACTTAVMIKKTPNLNGLNDDGSLPPLP